jgi:RNA polymerase sigma-70 factor (ECF subfamily)
VVSDEKLARAAQGGDAVSLGILLERHRAPLYAIALRVLGHRPQQAQDVFVAALSTIGHLRDPRVVGRWLRGILRNVCLMQLREHRGEVPFDELPVALGKDPEPSVEESLDRLAMRKWVWTALGELPQPLRASL